jgi:hypothetical protein
VYSGDAHGRSNGMSPTPRKHHNRVAQRDTYRALPAAFRGSAAHELRRFPKNLAIHTLNTLTRACALHRILYLRSVAVFGSRSLLAELRDSVVFNEAISMSESETTDVGLLAHARGYAARGWSVIAVEENKSIRSWRGYQEKPADWRALKWMFAREGVTGVAVIGGAKSRSHAAKPGHGRGR